MLKCSFLFLILVMGGIVAIVKGDEYFSRKAQEHSNLCKYNETSCDGEFHRNGGYKNDDKKGVVGDIKWSNNTDIKVRSKRFADDYNMTTTIETPFTTVDAIAQQTSVVAVVVDHKSDSIEEQAFFNDTMRNFTKDDSASVGKNDVHEASQNIGLRHHPRDFHIPRANILEPRFSNNTYNGTGSNLGDLFDKGNKSKLGEDSDGDHTDAEHHDDAPLDDGGADKCTCHHGTGDDAPCPCDKALDKHEKDILIAILAIVLPIIFVPIFALLIAKYCFGWSLATYGCICMRSGRGKKAKVINLLSTHIGGDLPIVRAQRNRAIQKYNRWYRKLWRYITNDTTTEEPVPLGMMPKVRSPPRKATPPSKKSTSPGKKTATPELYKFAYQRK